MEEAKEDATSVGCTVTNRVCRTMDENDGRRHRRGSLTFGRSHPVGRDTDALQLGAEESPLRVGESLLLLREPRSGRDRNLWRLILYESLRSATRDRQSTATDKDRKLRESKIELVSSFAIALSRIRIIPAYSEDWVWGRLGFLGF